MFAFLSWGNKEMKFEDATWIKASGWINLTNGYSRLLLVFMTSLMLLSKTLYDPPPLLTKFHNAWCFPLESICALWQHFSVCVLWTRDLSLFTLWTANQRNSVSLTALQGFVHSNNSLLWDKTSFEFNSPTCCVTLSKSFKLLSFSLLICETGIILGPL